MQPIKSKEQEAIALDFLYQGCKNAKNATWMLKKPTKGSVYFLFKTLLLEAKLKQGAYLANNNAGVVFFYHDKTNVFSLKLILLKLMLFLKVTGIKNGIKATKHRKEMDKLRPKNGYVAAALGTSQNRAGIEAGFEIYRSITEIALQHNTNIYAETTAPRIKQLYKRLGFKEYNKVVSPYSNLKTWFLELTTTAILEKQKQ